MGICLSHQMKAKMESAAFEGINSATVGTRTGNMGSSKASSFSNPTTPRSEGEILQCPNVKRFTYAELKSATRNFRPDSVLGEGGFGHVFKGHLDEQTLSPAKPGSGIVVAVKRLNQGGWQGHREWLAEINYLGQLRHPNLVKLVGYCLEDDQRLLVYEFMAKGSMENHLFRRGSYFTPLSWDVRMKIALGAARGLAFLHSADTKVIYRDFKASNILLDASYHAKLSDFGLARDGPIGDKSHVSTRIMGTQGYAAPEYLSTGHLTTKSDVYSFGVVLLEFVTGRKVLDKTRPSGEQNLVEWAKPYLTSKRRIFRVLDSRLEGQYAMPRVLKVADLALHCLCMDPKSRPSMAQVVTILEQLQDSPSQDQNTEGGSSQNGQPGQRSMRYCNTSVERAPVRAVSYPRPSLKT